MQIVVLNMVISLVYIALLTWVYEVEILKHWYYMGFGGEVVFTRVANSFILTALLTLLLPNRKTTRSYYFTVLHYAYFLPSILIITVNDDVTYAGIFLLAYVLVYIFSSISVGSIVIAHTNLKTFNNAIVAIILLGVLLYIAYGGLRHFNLDIGNVYQFRRLAAAELPSFFGYIFTNISNILIPIILVISLAMKKWVLSIFAIISSILFFGMTHHKLVLFTPFITLLFFWVFQRRQPQAMIGALFLFMLTLSAAEIIYYRDFLRIESPGYFTSLFVRRALLIPPALDRIYIEFFSDHPKYFWSTSKLGLGLVEPPVDLAAPFLIGAEFFSGETQSANVGIIGSGFSHAGLFGVCIYSIVTGLLISLLNAYGRNYGHAFIASFSVLLIVTIFNTTDLTTAFLTHGLVLLVFILAIAPNNIARIIPESRKRSILRGNDVKSVQEHG